MFSSIPVCSEYNHVRSWSVTRFRGMISTQPGSMPLASFKIVSIEDAVPPTYYTSGNDFGRRRSHCHNLSLTSCGNITREIIVNTFKKPFMSWHSSDLFNSKMAHRMPRSLRWEGWPASVRSESSSRHGPAVRTSVIDRQKVSFITCTVHGCDSSFFFNFSQFTFLICINLAHFDVLFPSHTLYLEISINWQD